MLSTKCMSSTVHSACAIREEGALHTVIEAFSSSRLVGLLTTFPTALGLPSPPLPSSLCSCCNQPLLAPIALRFFCRHGCPCCWDHSVCAHDRPGVLLRLCRLEERQRLSSVRTAPKRRHISFSVELSASAWELEPVLPVFFLSPSVLLRPSANDLWTSVFMSAPLREQASVSRGVVLVNAEATVFSLMVHPFFLTPRCLSLSAIFIVPAYGLSRTSCPVTHVLLAWTCFCGPTSRALCWRTALGIGHHRTLLCSFIGVHSLAQAWPAERRPGRRVHVHHVGDLLPTPAVPSHPANQASSFGVTVAVCASCTPLPSSPVLGTWLDSCTRRRAAHAAAPVLLSPVGRVAHVLTPALFPFAAL